MNAPVTNVAPAIGAEWEGGIYAGISIENNAPVHLVLLPGEAESVTWKKALAWAEKQSGVLPSRIDQLVLWQNLKREFKEEWYWSGEQHSGDSDDAWLQGFADGHQGWGHEDGSSRARAVRRLPIQ